MQTIFIDFDGTLHDSDSKYAARLEGILDLSGIYLWHTYLRLHREIVHTRYLEKHDDLFFHLELLLSHLRLEVGEKVIVELAHRFEEAQRQCWEEPTFFPDALPFMNEVKDRGYQICLTTGDHAREKAQSVEREGNRRYFDFIFDREQVGLKGEPEYLKKALSLCGSLPENTISVGDSLTHDVRPAILLGLKTIWVNREGAPTQDNIKPDYEVRDLREALKHL